VASAHVTDYTHANYIPVIDGQVLVWEEYAYVRHSANLFEYRRVIDETNGMVDMFPESHMKKLLNIDIAHLRDMLDSFARSQEDRDRKQYPKVQERQQAPPQANSQGSAGKNPHFTRQHRAQVHSAPRSDRMARENTPEPMEVDPSLSRMQPSHAPVYPKSKPATSGRSIPPKRQRVNHVAQVSDDSDKTYATAATSAAVKVNDDAILEYDSDAINFLGVGPCYPSGRSSDGE